LSRDAGKSQKGTAKKNPSVRAKFEYLLGATKLVEGFRSQVGGKLSGFASGTKSQGQAILQGANRGEGFPCIVRGDVRGRGKAGICPPRDSAQEKKGNNIAEKNPEEKKKK